MLLTAGALVMAMPFLWMLWMSLTPQSEIFSGKLIPTLSLEAALANYFAALTDVPLLRFMLNGVIVTAGILIFQLLISLPFGYALAKLRVPGKSILFGAVVFGLMIPIQIPTIPIYLGIAHAGLLNTYAGLIIPFVISVFAAFLFRQFFKTFPDEIIDAARLDGYSELAIVWRIVLPSAWPAIAAFSIFSIVAHWNDLYWPLVVTTRADMMTPPLGLLFFGDTGVEASGNVGALMAGGVIVTTPLVAVFLVAQRQFISGLTMTSLQSGKL